MITLSNELIDQLCAYRNKAREKTVMMSLGISDNTWRKVRSGQPIRRSVAERLAERLKKDIEL